VQMLEKLLCEKVKKNNKFERYDPLKRRPALLPGAPYGSSSPLATSLYSTCCMSPFLNFSRVERAAASWSPV